MKRNFFNRKNIPNGISLFRIILIFPIIIFLEINLKGYIRFLILIGGISDYLDGFVAKKFNLKTKLGAIIDPLADKIIIMIPLTWLCVNEIIPFWSFSLIIFRELVISSIRSSKDNGMPAINVAKYKSFFQYLALLFLFFPFKNDLIFILGLFFYWISFVFSTYSFINYLRFK